MCCGAGTWLLAHRCTVLNPSFSCGVRRFLTRTVAFLAACKSNQQLIVLKEKPHRVYMVRSILALEERLLISFEEEFLLIEI